MPRSPSLPARVLPNLELTFSRTAHPLGSVLARNPGVVAGACRDPNGKVANELLYRHDEGRIEVVELGREGQMPSMAAKNKFLAPRNKSADGGKATKERKSAKQRTSNNGKGRKDKTEGEIEED